MHILDKCILIIIIPPMKRGGKALCMKEQSKIYSKVENHII